MSAVRPQKPSRFPFRTVLVAVYLFLASAAAVNIGVHETKASALLGRIAAREDLNGTISNDINERSKNLGFVLSHLLRWIDPASETPAQAAAGQVQVLAMSRQLQEAFLGSVDGSVVLAGFTLLFIVAIFAFREGDQPDLRLRIYALLCVSLIFFVIGISLPVVTAVVKGQHRLIGGFIIQTASKGIVSTVLTLFKAGNWMIGLLLGGFSIAIPIFKAVAVLYSLIGNSRTRRAKTGKLLETIGRWALTDVMVAAVLLSCFSLNALKQEDGGIFAVPRIAFGFFVAYCMAAAWTSILLRRSGSGPNTASSSAVSLRQIATGSGLLIAALAGGASLSYYGLAESAFARETADAAVVKLVRTHAAILDNKARIGPEKPALIAFDVPFTGLLSIDLEAPNGATLGVAVSRQPSSAPNAKAATAAFEPVRGFPDEVTRPYRHSARVLAGHYRLAIHDEAGSGDRGPSETVKVHIALDP